MKVLELISQVRDNLQDDDANYWSDSELLHLHNECKRHLASERQEVQTSKLVPLVDGTNSYSVDGVLRYISAVDSDDNVRELYADDGAGTDDELAIIIHNYNLIYVNTPESGVTLVLKVVSFPSDDNLNSTVRQGDENSFKYYILSKAYEKESDMENFGKSSYFQNMFRETIRFIKKNSSLNYIEKEQTTKGYFY